MPQTRLRVARVEPGEGVRGVGRAERHAKRGRRDLKPLVSKVKWQRFHVEGFWPKDGVRGRGDGSGVVIEVEEEAEDEEMVF